MWWKKHDRLSVGSTKSKETAETSRLSLDSFDTTPPQSPSSIENEIDCEFAKDEETLILEPLPLLGNDPSWSAGDSTEYNDCVVLHDDENEEDSTSLYDIDDVQESSVLFTEDKISWDTEPSDVESKEDGDSDDDEAAADQSSFSEKPKLDSPQWAQPKPQRTFGGKLRRVVKSNGPSTQSGQVESVVLKDTTNTERCDHDVKQQQGKKAGRKSKRTIEDFMTPRTEKEVNYYRTRFQQVDREVKLNVESVDPLPKRPRRQPKRLNLR